MKQLITLLLFFSLLPTVFSQSEPLCSGKSCYYQKITVPLKIEKISINARLNRDSSVDFSQIINVEYGFQNKNINGILKPEFYLPPSSFIPQESIIVEDLQRHKKFEPRNSIEDEDILCDGVYVYNKSENSITLCIQASRENRIKIDAKILSNLDYQSFTQCGEIYDSISNSLEIPYLPTKYSYDMGVITEGGEGVKMNPMNETACQDPTLKLKVSPHPNGFRCDGTVLPIQSDDIRIFTLSLGGKDELKIKEKQEEELKNLQKQNINASIMASQATNTIKYTSIANSVLTAILVLATIFYAYTTHTTLKEDRKSKKKQSNDEVIESIYEPLHQETNNVLNMLEEDLGLSSLSTQNWDYFKLNKIKNLVKISPNLRAEIEDLYKNIKEYNESLNPIREKVHDLVNNSLRSNQQPTDIIYTKVRRGDSPVFLNFRTSIIKNKHPRDILKNYKGTKEGWSTPDSEIFDDGRNKIIDGVFNETLNLTLDDKEFKEFTQLRNKITNSAKQLKEKLENIIVNLQS